MKLKFLFLFLGSLLNLSSAHASNIYATGDHTSSAQILADLTTNVTFESDNYLTYEDYFKELDEVFEDQADKYNRLMADRKDKNVKSAFKLLGITSKLKKKTLEKVFCDNYGLNKKGLKKLKGEAIGKKVSMGLFPNNN